MEVLLLCLIVFSTLSQNVLMSAYTKKHGERCTFLLTAFIALAALAVFFFAGGFSYAFAWRYVPYSVGFALSYAAAVLFTCLAIREGSLSLTCLVTSYSLLIPALYGMLFLHETIGVFMIVGIVLLALSLFLINREKKEGEGERKITWRWVFFVSLAFLGNGFCSTTQKMEQEAFDGEGTTEFMLVALALTALLFFALSLLRERRDHRDFFRSGWQYGIFCGLANGACNFFVILLNPRMPASVMYPLISAGGIVATALVSVFVFGERLSRTQWVGMAIGVISIVFLNLKL